MKEFQTSWGASDVAAGDAVIAGWTSGQPGGRANSYANTYRGLFELVARADRAWILIDAIGGQLPNVIDVIPARVGSHRKEAIERMAQGDPMAIGYLATLNAAKGLYASWRQVKLGGPQLTVPGDIIQAGIPVVVAVTVVGIAAVAGATWYGIDRNEKAAEVELYTAQTVAQVDQYIRDLQVRAAAGQPLPEPPPAIIKGAMMEKSGKVFLAGAGAVLAAAAAAGIYFSTRTRANPHRRPRMLSPPSERARPRRALSQRGRVFKTRTAGGSKRSKIARAKAAKQRARRIPPGIRANPSHRWKKVGTGVYKKGKRYIRKKGSKWRVLLGGRVLHESSTLAGAKRLASTPARKKNAAAAKKRAKPSRAARKSTKRTTSRRAKKKTTKRKNPLRAGHSKAVVGANIAKLRREGMPAPQAAAASLRSARAAWVSKNKRKALPAHLKPKKSAAPKRPAKKRAVKKTTRRDAPKRKRNAKKKTKRLSKAAYLRRLPSSMSPKQKAGFWKGYSKRGKVRRAA